MRLGLHLGLGPRGIFAVPDDVLTDNPSGTEDAISSSPNPVLYDTGDVEHSVEFPITLNAQEVEVFPLWIDANNNVRVRKSGSSGGLRMVIQNFVGGSEYTARNLDITGVSASTPVLFKVDRSGGFLKIYADGVELTAFTLAYNEIEDASFVPNDFMRVDWIVGTPPTTYTFRTGGASTPFEVTASSYDDTNDWIEFSIAYPGMPTGVEYRLNGTGPWLRAVLVDNPSAGVAEYRTPVITSPTGLQTVNIRQRDIPANTDSFTVTITAPALLLATISDAAYAFGVPESGTFGNINAGANLSVTGEPDGFIVNEAARTWAWDGTGADFSGNIAVTQTLADSPNSPRTDNLAIAVTGGDAGSDGLTENPVDPPVTVTSPANPLLQDTGSLEHSVEFPITLEDTEIEVFTHWDDANNNVVIRKTGGSGGAACLIENYVGGTPYTARNLLLDVSLDTEVIMRVARRNGFIKIFIDDAEQADFTLEYVDIEDASFTPNDFIRLNKVTGTMPAYYTFSTGAALFELSENNYSVVDDKATFTVLYGGEPFGYRYRKNGGAWVRAILVDNPEAGVAEYITEELGLVGAGNIEVEEIDEPDNSGIFAVEKPIDALFGLNLDGEIYFGGESIHSNLLQASVWKDVSEPVEELKNQVPGASTIVNSDGELVTMGTGGGDMWRAMIRPGGTSPVNLTLKATGTFTWSLYIESPTTVTNVVNSSAGGYTIMTFDLDATYEDGGKNIWLIIESMDTGDPIRNLDCRETARSTSEYIRAEYYDRTDYSDGGPRVMALMNANGPGITNPPTWAERSLPNKFYDALPRDGAPLEILIDRANTLDKGSIWVTPHMYAPQDYLEGMWEMLHDDVDPSFEIFTQPGNEPDNFFFPLKNEMLAQALANGRATSGDVTANGEYWVIQREHAFQMNRHSAILLDMGFPANRFVRVLSALTEGNVLPMIKDTHGCTAFDAVANAPYFGSSIMDGGFTTDMTETFTRLTDAMNDVMDTMAVTNAAVKAAGYRSIAYEGGIHWLLADGYTSPQLAHYLAVQRHPSMKILIKAYLNRWKDDCGDLFCYYSSLSGISGFGAWGLREHMDQILADTPKLDAFLEVVAGV